MADKFYDGMPDVNAKLNAMDRAFAAGPYDALPKTGGALSGPVTSTSSYHGRSVEVSDASGIGRVQSYSSDASEPCTDFVRWTGGGVNYFGARLALSGEGLRIDVAPTGAVGSQQFSTGLVITLTGDTIGRRMLPMVDNTYDIGQASTAYRTIYARTGAINTSDARLKCDFRDLSAAEIAAGRDLARAICSYRWRDAIDAKGTQAREHVGPTVQRAIEIMQSHGLDPFNYGFICYDQWPRETIEHPVAEACAAYTEVVREAGDRYAFRYDELAMFIAAGQEARLAALEAA